MKVKICGITNLEDALVASDAGADYLGFVFYPPSSRAVDPHSVRKIAYHLLERTQRPRLVGVFVDQSAEAIAATLDYCWLDLAQLSGDEAPSLINDVASPLYGRCYKALRPLATAEAEAEAERYLPPALPHPPSRPALLVDSYHPTMRGGTGETGDWLLSARLARNIPGLMLAGGLTVENVSEAVREVRPFAVDVASGVEASPGKKDHALVRRFIEAARGSADISPPGTDSSSI